MEIIGPEIVYLDTLHSASIYISDTEIIGSFVRPNRRPIAIKTDRDHQPETFLIVIRISLRVVADQSKNLSRKRATSLEVYKD